MTLQPLSLSMWRLVCAVVTVVLGLWVRRCYAGSVCSTMCTVVDETKCTCTAKPPIAGSSQVGNYISCSGLGSISVVPAFTCSLTLTEFSINESSLAVVQRWAFSGIRTESLWLTGLGISFVYEQAFSGLESVLRTVSLGYNSINVLAGNTFARLEKLESVVLEHNQLTEIASGLFRDLSQLVNINLQRNSISTVHGDAFDGLGTLQTLDMSENLIADLPANFLIGAARVRELRLAGNRLTSLTSPAFNAMPNMITLDLSRNLLNHLPANMLPGCPNLNVLYLSSNNISSISSLAIAALKRLQIIYAQDNSIGRIPFDAFLNASTLKEASFASNKISQLDAGLFRNTPNLQTLNLSYNSILSVPDDVFPPEGSNVKIFDISYNRLSQANFLVRLDNLITVDLSYNQISKMNFAGTPQLNILKASHNLMTHFSKELLSRLPRLRELYLDYNLIDFVESGWIERNPNLQILSLGNNLLSAVPLLNGTRLTILRLNDNRISRVSGLRCPVLSELYLQNNLLAALTSDMFYGLSSLKILDLSNNSIRFVPQFVFSTVNNLQILRLADNGIAVVSSENFYGLSNLRSVDLSGNNLQTLTYAAMSDLLAMKLAAMFLASNPFICSCEILWIRGSRVLQDKNTSICFVDKTCYHLMCNPVRSCSQVVSPLYSDSDPFCLEIPDSCPEIPETTTNASTLASPPIEFSPVMFHVEGTSEVPNRTWLTSAESVGKTTNAVNNWVEIPVPTAVAASQNSNNATIYIIIGIVVGVVLMIIAVIVLVCLIRRRNRNEKDPLKQVRDYRGSKNDEIGILKGDQSSELEYPPLTTAVEPKVIEKQTESVPIPGASDGDLDSSLRHRPKGTNGFPDGNFRIPGSDGRRGRTGVQVDRPPYEFEDAPNEPETERNDDDDDDVVLDRKRQRNEPQFIDDDRNSNDSEDFQLPAKFSNYLLWRGGHQGSYKTEKLPKDEEENDDNESKKKKRQKIKSEFTDYHEDCRNVEETGPYDAEKLPKGFCKDEVGSEILWRGAKRDPYLSEKLKTNESEDETSKGKSKSTTTQNRRRGRISEFVEGEEQFPPLNSGDFRMPSTGTDLLWRTAQKGPYSSEQFANDEPDARSMQVKMRRNPDRQRTEFKDYEETNANPSDDFRLPFKTGPDLLWRSGQIGPYASEKLSRTFSVDETANEASKSTERKHRRRPTTNSFCDSAGEEYAAGNFRFPVMSGDDLLWRAGRKRPYDTATVRSQGKRESRTQRRLSSATEHVDSNGNNRHYSSFFAEA